MRCGRREERRDLAWAEERAARELARKHQVLLLLLHSTREATSPLPSSARRPRAVPMARLSSLAVWREVGGERQLQLRK